jgi:drug/metabolite transporter (DMT)-like permease
VPRPLAVLMLLSTTIMWGFAFVAQKSAMESLGPLSFAAARYLLGAAILVPLALWELRRHRRSSAGKLTAPQWRLIAIICAVFFFGSIFQQWGLTATTVTNGGFLTGLYVFFTPLFGWLVYRTRAHPVVVLCIPLALAGLFLLNGGTLDRFGFGDLLVIACALFWGVHVLLLGTVSRDTGLPIAISWLCFASSGLLAAVLAPFIETPSWPAFIAATTEILYAGVLSTAVAFTFQAIAQQYVPAANSAIILSSESLFAALGGALLLGERLTPMGYAGCALMFVAIVMVETVPAVLQRNKPLAPIA